MFDPRAKEFGFALCFNPHGLAVDPHFHNEENQNPYQTKLTNPSKAPNHGDEER